MHDKAYKDQTQIIWLSKMQAYFPKMVARKAVYTYFISLVLVSLLFFTYEMDFKFMLIGSIFVCTFFYASHTLSIKWSRVTSSQFVRKVFLTALALRVVYVFFSYYFYMAETGVPFEWGAADSIEYHYEAEEFARYGWKPAWDYLFTSRNSYSDSGYSFYLFMLYTFIGPRIIAVRLIKAVIGSFTCVLIYKLARRNFGESTGRMAGIFCVFMPNMIYYCGLHLKETEMVFLTVAFLERADYLLRAKKYNIINILVPALLALSLFLFRTVIGAVAVMSFFAGLLFTSTKIVGKAKKVIIICFSVLFVAVMAGGTIITEVEEVWNARSENQALKRYQQTIKGNQWAKYATGGVMAPMIFVVPFATMVDVQDQYSQQLVHGGNFVKNVMGIFVVFAFVYLLFINKKWKDHSLLGAFAIGYLGVIAFSGYANAERFHMPTLPLLMLFAAYGVSQLNEKNKKYVGYWFYVVFLMEFGWAFFKLGSRGILGI